MLRSHFATIRFHASLHFAYSKHLKTINLRVLKSVAVRGFLCCLRKRFSAGQLPWLCSLFCQSSQRSLAYFSFACSDVCPGLIMHVQHLLGVTRDMNPPSSGPPFRSIGCWSCIVPTIEGHCINTINICINPNFLRLGKNSHESKHGFLIIWIYFQFTFLGSSGMRERIWHKFHHQPSSFHHIKDECENHWKPAFTW